MIVFGLMSLLGVIVDMGYARLSQMLMQNAVDSASIHGLGANRAEAKKFLEWHFDSSPFDSLPNDGTYGAGPVVELTGGIGDADASALIQSVGLYLPNAQLNQSNFEFGDMVVGDYLGGAASEDANYLRPDFVPNQDGEAFLVRLRRTVDASDWPNAGSVLDRVIGVSSSGPPIPFLFARGGLMTGGDPTAGYSPRHHGLTVRATSIALLRPVLSVGVGAADLPGVTAFAIEVNLLDSPFESNTLGAICVQADGTTQEGLTVYPVAFTSTVVHVGDFLAAGDMISTASGYAPMTDPSGRVIGFLEASLLSSDDANCEFELTLQSVPRVAPENASASLRSEHPPLTDSIWNLHDTLSRRVALLAPISAR